MKNTTKNTQPASFRNLYAFAKKLPIDLSLSENPLGCSPKVAMVLNRLTQADFFDYPDPDCKQLKRVISDRFQIKAEDIFVANGSEAIIKLLPQVLLGPGDEVIIPSLTFPLFEIASKMSGAKVIFSEMTQSLDINLADIQSKISKKTKLIFLCNPNNPTGRVIPKKTILDFVKSTKVHVIVDEANIEFGGETLIKDTSSLANLIVIRTFSKGFGLAGLRVGFCAANKELVQQLQKVGQPFPVSTVAEKAAIAAFADTKFIDKSKKFMQQERNFLSRELRKRGFAVVESEANNLLVVIPIFLPDLVSKLNEKGVSVVDGLSFNVNNAKFIRVSPRLRAINRQFIAVIDQLLKEQGKQTAV